MRVGPGLMQVLDVRQQAPHRPRQIPVHRLLQYSQPLVPIPRIDLLRGQLEIHQRRVHGIAFVLGRMSLLIRKGRAVVIFGRARVEHPGQALEQAGLLAPTPHLASHQRVLGVHADFHAFSGGGWEEG